MPQQVEAPFRLTSERVNRPLQLEMARALWQDLVADGHKKGHVLINEGQVELTGSGNTRLFDLYDVRVLRGALGGLERECAVLI